MKKRSATAAVAALTLPFAALVISAPPAAAATWRAADGCISRNGDVRQKVYLYNSCGRDYYVRATFTCTGGTTWKEYGWSRNRQSTVLTAAPFVTCWYSYLEWQV